MTKMKIYVLEFFGISMQDSGWINNLIFFMIVVAITGCWNYAAKYIIKFYYKINFNCI